MRKGRTLAAACAATIFAASTIAVAGALISSSGPGVIRLTTPPGSVALNRLEHPTSAFTFDEQQGVTLSTPVAVDAVGAGTFTKFPNGKATIPTGTIVDSHLIHSDPPSKNFTAHRTGSVTFTDDILGVIGSTARLAASDPALGAPGTTYAGNTTYRGFDTNAVITDSLVISSDRRTITFDIQTPEVMDELRVLTGHTNRLTTVITANPNPVQTGSNVVYTLTVTNNGSYTAPGVTVQDSFPGATYVSANSSGGCSGTGPVTCALGSIAAGSSAAATVTVQSPAIVPVSGTIVNQATAPAGQAPMASASTTVVSPVLDTAIADSPDPVTAGNNVQYTITVTNHGIAPVADAHAIDTLPPGTSLVQASSSGGCTGSGPVDCALGPLAVNASAVAKIVVASPATVPDSGTIEDSATASPGSNPTANETTTVEASQPGVAKGFVLPGGSITIPGDNPATVTLPDTGDGAPIVITQGDGSFCDGPCDGPATTISDFPGYIDPLHPIRLTLTYTFPDGPDSLTHAATAFGSTIYKNDDPMSPNLGAVVPACTSQGGGVAVPHPCVDTHTIAQPTFNSFVVTFEILYISGDPRFARR